jgi:hypothetical protein
MPVSEITNSKNASTPHSPRATTDVLDFELLSAFERITSDDGSDVVIELIDLYLQGTSQRIVTMLNAANDEEWALLKRAAHTLKDGAPGTTRTCDPLIRSQVLYPAELRVRERN